MRQSFSFIMNRFGRGTANWPQSRPASTGRGVWLSLLLAGLPGLLTGCFISKEKIPFTDEADVARQQAAVVAADEPKAVNLSMTDESAMETAAYTYMLERELGDTNQYTAVFVQGSDDEVARLQAKFPNHNPPLKSADHALLHPPQPPQDKDTGRAAMILSLDIGAPVGDTVAVLGRWYSTDLMTGDYHFTLKKTGTDWAIDSVK